MDLPPGMPLSDHQAAMKLPPPDHYGQPLHPPQLSSEPHGPPPVTRYTNLPVSPKGTAVMLPIGPLTGASCDHSTRGGQLEAAMTVSLGFIITVVPPRQFLRRHLRWLLFGRLGIRLEEAMSLIETTRRVSTRHSTNLFNPFSVDMPFRTPVDDNVIC